MIGIYNLFIKINIVIMNFLTNVQEDAQEEFGWKLVHGDVFRPPRKGMFLTVLVGNGAQLFCMTLITLGKILTAHAIFTDHTSSFKNHRLYRDKCCMFTFFVK